MNFAGNPYRTLVQEQPCVYCGASLSGPASRSFSQKAATRVAATLTRLQKRVSRERPQWVHLRLTGN